MPSKPAPLFFVALCFAVGCAAGFASSVAWSIWICLWLITVFTWAIFWFFKKEAKATSGAFLLCVLCLFTGAFHQAINQQLISKCDLRLLDDSKFSSRVTWKGTIQNAPQFQSARSKIGSGKTHLIFKANSLRLENEQYKPADGVVAVTLKGAFADEYFYGDELEIVGPLEVPVGATNPGQFDRKEYLARQNIFYEIHADVQNVKKIKTAQGAWWWRVAYALRQWSIRQLRLEIEDDPPIANLLSSMVIGDTHDIPHDIENAFRKTNTYHVFAVSGQNVGMILLVGLIIFKLTGILRWKWGWVLAPPLIFYCLMTGASPSSVRALLMALLVLAAWKLDRPVSGLNLWSIAAFASLIYDPLLIASLSFQLSFSVVLALLLLTGPIFRFVYKPLAPDPFLLKKLVPDWRRNVDVAARWTVGLVASSVAAWIGSLPLLAYYFHQVSLSGLFANLFVVPMAGLIVVIGTMSLGGGLLSGTLAAIFNQLNWLLAKILVAVVFWFSSWSWSSVAVPDWRHLRSIEKPEIVFLDTQGITSALIRYKGHNWLINPGNSYSFSTVVNAARQFYGINKFDGVIVTESGKAAAGSIEEVVKSKLAEKCFAPFESPTIRRPGWIWVKARPGIPVKPLQTGQTLELASGFTMEILSPIADRTQSRLADRGLVLLFRFKDRSLLWTGRIGNGVEQELLQKYPNLKCDALFQGFNEQDPNFGLDWLRAIKVTHVIEGRGIGMKLDGYQSADQAHESCKWWSLDRLGALKVVFADNEMQVMRLVSGLD